MPSYLARLLAIAGLCLATLLAQAHVARHAAGATGLRAASADCHDAGTANDDPANSNDRADDKDCCPVCEAQLDGFSLPAPNAFAAPRRVAMRPPAYGAAPNDLIPQRFANSQHRARAPPQI